MATRPNTTSTTQTNMLVWVGGVDLGEFVMGVRFTPTPPFHHPVSSRACTSADDEMGGGPNRG